MFWQADTASSVVRRRALVLAPTLAIAAALLAPQSAVAVVERDFFNKNVIFKDDFFFKFGTKPAPLARAPATRDTSNNDVI